MPAGTLRTYLPSLIIVGVLALAFGGYILTQVMNRDAGAMRADRQAIDLCEASAKRDASYRRTCDHLRSAYRANWNREP